MPEEELEIKPVWKLMKIDDTRYWDKDFVARVGKDAKFFSLYVYDEMVRTHCCELTPSYFLEFIGTEITGYDEHTEEEWEDIHNKIRESNVDDCSHYRHCSRCKNSIDLSDSIDADKVQEVAEQLHANGSRHFTGEFVI